MTFLKSYLKTNENSSINVKVKQRGGRDDWDFLQEATSAVTELLQRCCTEKTQTETSKHDPSHAPISDVTAARLHQLSKCAWPGSCFDSFFSFAFQQQPRLVAQSNFPLSCKAILGNFPGNPRRRYKM